MLDLKVSEKSLSTPINLLHLPFVEDFVDNINMDVSLASSAANLTDDQIAGMIVNESSVSLTADTIQQFNVTPKLCAKILCAICENPQIRPNDNQQLTQRCEEIDTFADICREILSSASPLTEIIQVLDNDAFISNGNKMFNNKALNKSNYSFQRFWQFCINLCTTDKQGLNFNIFFF